MLQIIDRIAMELYPADITDDGYARIAGIIGYFMDGGDIEGLIDNEDYEYCAHIVEDFTTQGASNGN